ncbi:TPA: glycosyltransferase family 2 protein [Candidatus Galligastranaerophilus intestinigallinarum]|nr:glycosyltransferase family 2 protein [Candidatus Galligastranaerophilus intestinigallinarum]
MVYMYIAVKHQKRKLRKNPVVYNENLAPFISILIPCHNEAVVIKETVENILNVDYENYEIIVIDDRSTDDTKDAVLELEKKYDKVKALIRDKSAYPGKSAVLNDAIKLAKGEAYLVFDADAKIKPDFIKLLLTKYEGDDVGAIQARKVIINANQNFLTACQYNEYVMDTHLQVGRDAVKGAVELRGNGELIKKNALVDIGGWNNETITDDLDMSTRLHIKGWDIRFVQDAIVYEEGVVTFSALVRQRRRWVEGSIRRYLEYIWDVLFTKDMSLRVGFDLIAYISEFLLPAWLIIEIIVQAFHFVKGQENYILSSAILIVVVGLFFTSGLIYSFRKYSHYTTFKAIIQAIITSGYFITIWFPIVMFIVFKIIFTKRTMDWGKTQHGVIQKGCGELI